MSSRWLAFLYSLHENSFLFLLFAKTDIETSKRDEFMAESNIPYSLSSESKSSLLHFVAQEISYALKLEQITIVREIKNTEYQTHRKKEDEKYNIILTNSRREDESRRTERGAKDDLLREIEKTIEDGELASDHKTLLCTQN